ncbi:MAG: glycosyltransferase [Leptospiraceae bacterium]|nr:glycosyltransferase [Leptospiraceae bacterium]
MMQLVLICALAYVCISLGKTALAFYYINLYERQYQPMLARLQSDSDLSTAASRQNSIATATRAYSDPSQVTIVQAILSGDPLLSETLQANIRSNPHCRFLWLVDEDDAEGRRITAFIQERERARLEQQSDGSGGQGKAELRIVICPPCPNGTNPKLFKLHFARQFYSTECLIVLDDDTLLPDRTRQALQAGLSQHALVTGLPVYRTDGRLATRLLAQFVNNNAALTYLPLAPLLPPISINGMCYALSQASLRALCNFEPLLSHLTDDLAVSDWLKRHGPHAGRIQQLPLVQYIQTSLTGCKQYRRQMQRWFCFAILLLKKESFGMQAVIWFLQGLPPILLGVTVIGALLFAGSHLLWGIWLLGTVLVLRVIWIVSLQLRLDRRIRYRPLLSELSELLQILHLQQALFSNVIYWRRRRYLVRANDDFTDLDAAT